MDCQPLPVQSAKACLAWSGLSSWENPQGWMPHQYGWHPRGCWRYHPSASVSSVQTVAWPAAPTSSCGRQPRPVVLPGGGKIQHQGQTEMRLWRRKSKLRYIFCTWYKSVKIAKTMSFVTNNLLQIPSLYQCHPITTVSILLNYLAQSYERIWKSLNCLDY